MKECEVIAKWERFIELQREGKYSEAYAILRELSPSVTAEDYQRRRRALWARAGDVFQKLGWKIPAEEYQGAATADSFDQPEELEKWGKEHSIEPEIIEVHKVARSGKGGEETLRVVDEMLARALRAGNMELAGDLARIGLSVSYLAGWWEKARPYCALMLEYTPFNFFLGCKAVEVYGRCGELVQARNCLDLCWGELKDYGSGPEHDKYAERLRRLEQRFW